MTTAIMDPQKNREGISMLSRRLIKSAILGGGLILGGALALGVATGALADPQGHSGYEPHFENHAPYGRGVDVGVDAGGTTTAGASAFGYYGPLQRTGRPGFAGAAFFNGWPDEDRFDTVDVRPTGCYNRCLLRHTERYCQKNWRVHCDPVGTPKRSARD
jgi:hypothetical protein